MSVIKVRAISINNIGLTEYEHHSSLYSVDLYDNMQYTESVASNPNVGNRYLIAKKIPNNDIKSDIAR